nr:hypothetical protein [Tanacetum cinerariifolium]
MMVYLKNMVGFKMDFFKGMSYDDIRPIFEKHFNSIVGFLEKREEELEEEASKVIKRKSKTSEEKAAKKQKLDEEVEELKTHLQIVPNDEDDVYTEATPLALKVPVVDYRIHTENNKPYYKIIRADGTHQLFLSFISLLRNFDREDLEMLWKIVQERFAFLEPKNFSGDFLLNTLKAMFKKSNVEANIWKNQRGSYGLAKVKSWKLFEFCGVYIITFTTTQMILLVERRYPLTRFTLDQMLNNMRLEVDEESEVSSELLGFFSFGVDAVEDFKEYTLKDYYCWLKTYYCWYKSHYIEKVLKRSDYFDVDLVKTPYDSSKCLKKNKRTGVSQPEYAKIIGTLNCCLHFNKFPDVLEGYCDANWVFDNDEAAIGIAKYMVYNEKKKKRHIRIRHGIVKELLKMKKNSPFKEEDEEGI